MSSLKKIIKDQECDSDLKGRRLVNSFFCSLSWIFDGIGRGSANLQMPEKLVNVCKVILSEIIGHILNGKYVDIQGTRL